MRWTRNYYPLVLAISIRHCSYIVKSPESFIIIDATIDILHTRDCQMFLLLDFSGKNPKKIARNDIQ